ncbi:MAG: ROK family transcriptional regulator [Acidimicrobiia bacterium]
MQDAADRQLIRAINRALVFQLIRREGPISRAEIARATGLTQVTVGTITSELMAHGLVGEGDQAKSTGGRPATLLHLVPQSYFAIGAKVMESHVVGAVTDLEGDAVAEVDVAIEGLSSNPNNVVDAIARLVDQLVARAGIPRNKVLGIGIGLAGVVDARAGICRYSPFLGWHDVHIRDMASRELGIPVFVDNDVNTLALAERWFGVGHDVADFVLVTLGRGVGLGIVADGRLYRGARGGAGEFGHTVVDGSDRPCACGNFGCLEATVSEPALVAAARTLMGTSGPGDAEELYRMIPESASLRPLFRVAGKMLGRSLANLVNLFAPTLLILSGEGIRAGDVLLDPLREELEARVFDGLRGTFQLVVEPLPDAAWARGAASLVLGELFELPTNVQADLLWSKEAVS